MRQQDRTARAARRAVWWAVVAVAGWAAQPAGQVPPAFLGGVDQVEVYATVTGPDGAPVAGLAAANFEILENGVPRPIETFEAGRAPVTVAVGIDRSWSMAGEPLRLARLAARGFLLTLDPGDRAMVMAIDSRAEIVAALDTPRAAQVAAVEALDPWSTTALRDGIIAGLDHLADEPGRQALIVFSDGTDRYSTAPADEVIERARRSRALVYPIALGRERPALLAELAVLTGGRSFLLPDATALDVTLRTILAELRTQYLLGYSPGPGDGTPGRWRSIRVRAVADDGTVLRVRARDGYFAD